MPDEENPKSVGTRSFHRELEDHESRIGALETGGGGGGGGGLLDSFHITDPAFLEPGQETLLPGLEFDQEEGSEVLVHAHITLSADADDFTFGPAQFGIWTIKVPGEELEREPDRPIALALPTLLKGGFGVPTILECLLPGEGFPGVLEPEDGKIHWIVQPRVFNPADSGVVIAVVPDIASPAGFGSGGGDRSFGYAQALS